MTDPDDALPNPYQRTHIVAIGPSRVPVMEQVFWVELQVSPDTPLDISVPDGVTILDRSGSGGDQTRTRIYLRSSRGFQEGEVSITGIPSGPIQLPLTVLTYREDIELQTREIQGLDEAACKGGRTYYTDELVSSGKENLASIRKSNLSVEHLRRFEKTHFGTTSFDEMDDEICFQSLPSWNMPRDCYSNWPCPDCGERIFRHSAFYPWKLEAEHPYRARCPECDKLFPSNDYAAGDLTSGDHPDDGWGWNPGTDDRDEYAGWISHYCHMFWKNLGDNIHRLTARFLLDGDQRAAHTLGVLLARMAYVYPGMNMRWQQVDSQLLRPGRLLLDGNWERNDLLVPVCRAYDAIFDYLNTDEELAAFIGTKDHTISGPGDVKALIETYLIQLFGWDWMRRELSGGNMGSREEDLAQFAVLADMGSISERWIKEIFTHAYNGGLDQGGFDDENLTNQVSREGVCSISGLGYAYGYLAHKSDMADILSRVESPIWKHRCDLYNSDLYPKFRAEFDTWVDLLVAGQFGPGYGDSGGPAGHKYPAGIPADIRTAYRRAYRRWPTDKLALALYKAGKGIPDLFEPDIWPQIEAHVARLSPEPEPESRVMDGVGFAILESRPNEPLLEDRSALILRYGHARGHHHQDNLSVELIAKGLSLTPDLGYPCWAHPMGDTSHVAHHITGMIDRSSQYRNAISHGDLEAFYQGKGIAFADISARPNGFPNRCYRRAICLVDAPDKNVYVLDILRIAGGTQRTWCFHGPPQDDFSSSLEFSATGNDSFDMLGLGRNWSNNIVNAKILPSDDQVWAAWSALDSNVRLRIDLLGQPDRSYILADCAKPDIPPIRYLFAEDENVDGASEFISVWQPFKGEPFIDRIERLPVEKNGTHEFAPLAIQVTLKNGRQDTLMYSSDSTCNLRSSDFHFSGRFGYWSRKVNQPSICHLVGGTTFLKGTDGISESEATYRSGIRDVDFTTNTITVDPPLSHDADLKGRLIFILCGNRRMAYHITSVMKSGKRIKLDLDPLIFRSKIVETGPHHLVCETPPPFEAFRGFEPGHYDGKLLTDEHGQAQYRIHSIDNCRINLDRPVNYEEFPSGADGRRMVRIMDFGPGDTVEIQSGSHAQID